MKLGRGPWAFVFVFVFAVGVFDIPGDLKSECPLNPFGVVAASCACASLLLLVFVLDLVSIVSGCTGSGGLCVGRIDIGMAITSGCHISIAGSVDL